MAQMVVLGRLVGSGYRRGPGAADAPNVPPKLIRVLLSTKETGISKDV